MFARPSFYISIIVLSQRLYVSLFLPEKARICAALTWQKNPIKMSVSFQSECLLLLSNQDVLFLSNQNVCCFFPIRMFVVSFQSECLLFLSNKNVVALSCFA